MEENINHEEELDDLIKMLESMNDEDIDFDSVMDILGIGAEELEEEFLKQSTKLEVKFKKSNPEAINPKYAYPTDSGFDLHSTEEHLLPPFGRKLIPTGIHIDIPENYEIQVRSKSGLALKQGLMVLNSPGTVDQGYTGEIQVILFNASNEKVKIEKNQKIAQAVFCPVVSGQWVNFNEESEIDSKDRSDNGFGSTGI